MSGTVALSDGHNVAIEAVPGAGKTHLIVTLCEDHVPSLILAYNRELADKVTKTLESKELTGSATCTTFHGLCSRCLALARDDHQLLKIVAHAETGRLVPTNVPRVARVFVDEAQDVRELYVRLLRVLGLTSVQIVVAGDRNQLVYDFDDDFPATLATLQFPDVTFGGDSHCTWQRTSMNESRRITRPMSLFVNAVFDTNISSNKEGCEVDVRVPCNMYTHLYDTIKDVLQTDEDVLILVDHKNGNRALRTLLNTVSRSGCEVHVHGVSFGECSANTIKCGTFWSAKGLEASTVIVLLPGQAPFNPTYVAMTRARRRLVIVLDPRNPHSKVSRVVLQNPSFCTARTTHWRRVLEEGARRPDEDSFAKRPRRSASFRCLDRATPKQSVVQNIVGETLDNVFTTDAPESDCESGDVRVMMGLVKAEFEETGVVRAMQDILCPSRLDYDNGTTAIRLGLMSRIVPRFATDDELLASDLRRVALKAYKDLSNINNLANVALATLSWDSWDCIMRSMQPTKRWASSTQKAVDFVVHTVPSGATYDVRLLTNTCHVRVHAMTSERAYHFVWQVTTSDVGGALVRAACHPGGECVLAQVCSEECFTIRVKKRDHIDALLNE
jgi:hypothetical protein